MSARGGIPQRDVKIKGYEVRFFFPIMWEIKNVGYLEKFPVHSKFFANFFFSSEKAFIYVLNLMRAFTRTYIYFLETKFTHVCLKFEKAVKFTIYN